MLQVRTTGTYPNVVPDTYLGGGVQVDTCVARVPTRGVGCGS